ncbi:hypothetical protein M0812_11809 [Anaeramoeba flamelloides]|uniref:Uncharacterized protein n=1 Tax=Anaeramoeba flamelloides TaxID=1746091 RepID=A0AAV7ZJD3_9EUKA|nr:hypothetical protein M0812_11809 [Anaeramoeba flamelloides]
MNLKFRNPHEDHFPHCVVDQLLSSKLDETKTIVDISPMCLSFNKQGSLLAVGYNEGSVLLWDYSTHNVVDRFFNITVDKQEEKKQSIKKELNKEILEKQTISNVNQENSLQQIKEEKTKMSITINNNNTEKEQKQSQVNEKDPKIINLQNKDQKEMEIEIKKEEIQEKEKVNENEKPIETRKPKGRGRGRGGEGEVEIEGEENKDLKQKKNNMFLLSVVNTLNEDPYLINISNCNKIQENFEEKSNKFNQKNEMGKQLETETDNKKEIEIEKEKEKEITSK